MKSTPREPAPKLEEWKRIYGEHDGSLSPKGLSEAEREEYLGSVGKRVKYLRGSEGLTQQELANKSALTIDQIKNIEGGRTDPTLTDLVELCKALGVSLDMLCHGVEHKDVTPLMELGLEGEAINWLRTKSHPKSSELRMFNRLFQDGEALSTLLLAIWEYISLDYIPKLRTDSEGLLQQDTARERADRMTCLEAMEEAIKRYCPHKHQPASLEAEVLDRRAKRMLDALRDNIVLLRQKNQKDIEQEEAERDAEP